MGTKQKANNIDIAKHEHPEGKVWQLKLDLTLYLENAPDGVYLSDLRGTFLYGNKKAELITGYKREELVGKSFLRLNILPAAYTAKAAKLLALNLLVRPTGPDEFELIRKDGTRIWVEITTTPVREHGKVVVIGFVRDITERKNAEHTIAFTNNILKTQQETSFDGILVVDEHGTITSFNKRFIEIWGIPSDIAESRSDERALNSVLDKLVDPDGFLMQVKYLYAHKEEKSHDEILLKDGRALDRYSAPMYGTNGHYYGRVWYFRDITERKQLQQKLEEIATHDYLTGLPNRVLLRDRFIVAEALARRNKARLAVMSLDMDKFKSINDTLGHEAGDQVLKVFSARLSGIIRASDTIARIGGDEFILLMLETRRREDAAAIAQKILDSCTEPLSIDGHQLHLSTSIGIAIYPEDAEDMETLIKKSDAAMYYSKGHGRNQFRFFGDGNV